MKLSKIVNTIDEIKIKKDIEIDNISINSKEVKSNSLFVAIKGYIKDGHDYIDEAINNGAIVVIVNENRYNEYKDKNALILKVNNTRDICPIIACNFYDNPSKSFTLIGVTGTKGKTTTTYMIKNILEKSGKKVGLISTIASYIDNKKISDNDRTTPEAFKLQETFKTMKDAGCKYVVMEVSSQSLKLNRVVNSDFNIGLFLNLSEEHVSKYEHKSINDYFNEKAKLFDMVNVGFINVDDKRGKKLINLKSNCTFETFSIDTNSKKVATDIYINSKYTVFNTMINNKVERVKLPMIGKYSVYNALGAISVCEYLKINTKDIVSALRHTKVPGRGELIKNELNLSVMIDYAHNASSLENVLTSIKKSTNKKIICVFGCAGNRGKVKRKEMGKISGTLADYTIITSDNPGSEDASIIAKEIEEGIKEITNNYEIIVDREKAIKRAIEIADKTDFILLAGKGHEKYQIIGDEKIPFSEKDIVKKYASLN